jgi:hypothetical protein
MYEVIVGNIGSVYRGDDRYQAVSDFMHLCGEVALA